MLLLATNKGSTEAYLCSNDTDAIWFRIGKYPANCSLKKAASEDDTVEIFEEDLEDITMLK